MAEYQVSQIYVRILLLLMEQDTNVSVPAEQLVITKDRTRADSEE